MALLVAQLKSGCPRKSLDRAGVSSRHRFGLEVGLVSGHAATYVGLRVTSSARRPREFQR